MLVVFQPFQFSYEKKKSTANQEKWRYLTMLPAFNSQLTRIFQYKNPREIFFLSLLRLMSIFSRFTGILLKRLAHLSQLKAWTNTIAVKWVETTSVKMILLVSWRKCCKEGLAYMSNQMCGVCLNFTKKFFVFFGWLEHNAM